MNVRSLILVVAALLIAVVTALFARNLLTSEGPKPAQAAAVAESKGPRVLVAAVPLPVGHIIEAAQVRWQKWPNDNLDQTYFVEGQTQQDAYVGKVVRTSMTPGQPLTQGALVGPGERGFLAAVLSEGMRAITVSVSDTSGVAGFVFPGDRVDLILTTEVPREDAPTIKVSQTVLRNVRVLAVDQRTNDLENQPKVGRTVTLEVTPKLVEKIAVMQRLGSLSLSLRPLTENAAAASGQSRVDEAPMPSDARPTYTLGSEVSKYANAKVGGGGGGGSQPAAHPGAKRGTNVIVLRGQARDETEVGTFMNAMASAMSNIGGAIAPAPEAN